MGIIMCYFFHFKGITTTQHAGCLGGCLGVCFSAAAAAFWNCQNLTYFLFKLYNFSHLSFAALPSFFVNNLRNSVWILLSSIFFSRILLAVAVMKGAVVRLFARRIF